MKDLVLSILTNHSQSSFDGLHQITGGDRGELQSAVDELVDEGVITTGTANWNGRDWIVYKKKKNKKNDN